MKNFLLTLTLVLAAMVAISTTAESQIIDLTGGAEVAAPVDPPVTDDGQTNHDRTLAEVRQAIEEDEGIGPWRKRILLRKLNRPKVALAVTDYVTAAAIDNGVIDMPAPPMWAADPNAPQGTFEVARLDLDGLLAFIERILPLIMQLIGLFGGWMLCTRRINVNSVLEWFELKEYEA